MITVNTSTLVFLPAPFEPDFLVLPTAVAALLDEPVVVSVRPCSVEFLLPVSDHMVRRAGQEAVARLAQVLFSADDQPVVVSSALGSPVEDSLPGFSAWGLRVVVVRSAAGSLVSALL